MKEYLFMEEKIKIKFDEELAQLLENEWFWLHNFNTNEKQNEEQKKHNEKMAQSLKEKLEEKYPNISLDVDTIKRLGVKYTKRKRQEESKRVFKKDWEKYREEQKQYPDWISAGSVLDVQVTHGLLKRENELRKNEVESPMEELKIIIAASKVDPYNLDMNLLDYLRKRKLARKIYKPIITNYV